MSNATVLISESILQDTADAIRSKSGTTEGISPVNFAANIASIASGNIAEEVDPTVPAWAKAPTKPTYTAQEVGALPSSTKIPSIEGLASEQYVDIAIDEIDVMTDEEIAEICGSTVGDLTVVDQDAIAEQVIDTLMEELPTNQALVDNVAEKVPIVKVAESPTFVDSKDEMTDTSKMYVLKSDGMFYAYKEVTTSTPGSKVPNFTNLIKFDASGNPTNVSLNQRYSGSATTTGYLAAQDGSFAITDAVPYVQGGLIYISKKPAGQAKVAIFKPDGTTLSGEGVKTIATTSWSSGDNGEYKAVSSAASTVETGAVSLKFSAQMQTAAITNANLKDLIVTYNEPITYTVTDESTTTTYEWSSTGIAYNQPADYEDRVIALETATANNGADIDMLKQKIANIESGETATVIPEWWEDEVADTIAKIKALQVGRNCVTFPFFSDNHQRNGYAGVLIKRVMDECHIPYCFFGGDGIANGYFGDETDEAMRAQDAKFDAVTAAIPEGRFCRAIGNHEYYWKPSSSETHYYTADQVYEVFLRQDTLTQSKEFGGDTYYYVEDKASKVRFIVMDMNTLDDAAQITWLQNVALHFNEDGWAVVLIGHQPVTEHYATVINGAAEARNALKNYISGSEAHKADVVGWWCGHVHRDRIFDGTAANPGYNGSTDPETDAATGDPIAETLPWKTVSIISDNTSIGYGGIKHAIDNSDQSHAIDFVTINKSTRIVNLTRLGFGNDRSFTY